MPNYDQIRTSLERADARRILDTALSLERLVLILDGPAKDDVAKTAALLRAYVADKLRPVVDTDKQ